MLLLVYTRTFTCALGVLLWAMEGWIEGGIDGGKLAVSLDSNGKWYTMRLSFFSYFFFFLFAPRNTSFLFHCIGGHFLLVESQVE